MAVITKTREELEDIQDEESTIITEEYDNEHRWFFTESMIFEENEKLYCTQIMIPKSESQEGQDTFYDEQECYEVVPREVTFTKTVWEVVK